jgi:hypothetical protein
MILRLGFQKLLQRRRILCYPATLIALFYYECYAGSAVFRVHGECPIPLAVFIDHVHALALDDPAEAKLFVKGNHAYASFALAPRNLRFLASIFGIFLLCWLGGLDQRLIMLTLLVFDS